jgi:hypothetical protein
MGVFVLVQELPGAAGLAVGITAAVAALAATVCWFAVPRCPLRTPLTA